MVQPNSISNEYPTTFHGHVKMTHESNPEEQQFHQDSVYNPNRRVTNENLGYTHQPRLHQYH